MDARSAWARPVPDRCASARMSLDAPISLDSPAGGQPLGDFGGGGVELRLLLRPRLGVPDLQVLAGADDYARPGEGGVLDQRLGDADAPGRVELLVEGAAVEAAAQAAGVLAERAVGREEAIRELLELLGRVQPHAGVEAFGENHSV